MEQAHGLDVGTELFFRPSNTQSVIRDAEVYRLCPFLCGLFLPFLCCLCRFFRLQRDMVILPDGVNRIQGHHFCGQKLQLPLYRSLIICFQTFQHIENELHLFRGELRF